MNPNVLILAASLALAASAAEAQKSDAGSTGTTVPTKPSTTASSPTTPVPATDPKSSGGSGGKGDACSLSASVPGGPPRPGWCPDVKVNTAPQPKAAAPSTTKVVEPKAAQPK